MLNLSGIEYILLGFNIVLSICILVLYIKFGKARNEITGMHSHIEDSREITEELVRIWQKKYQELPRGTVKWNAYRSRLDEVGRLNGS